MKLVTAAEMRALEQAAVAEGATLDALMEQAGLAVAQEVWLNLGVVSGRRVLVLVGPGNNGGDGLVAARHLADFDADICVYMLRHRGGDKNLEHVRERVVPVIVADDDADLAQLQEALEGAEVIVDALLGIGAARPIEGVLAEILRRLRAVTEGVRPPRVFAVDVPTGVDADTGRADQLAVIADHTVTFGASKAGLHMGAGSEHAGCVEVVDIGLPKAALDGISTELLELPWVKARLPKRDRHGNKGTFGKVMVVGGSKNFVGAPRLTAEAAYRAGAGLVTIASTDDVQEAIAGSLPEATWLQLADDAGTLDARAAAVVEESLGAYSAAIVGPGLGRSPGVTAVVLAALACRPERGTVIDADGLNALAEVDDWPSRANGTLILTPHPGEMARLLRTTVESVQADRLKSAIDAAGKWRQVVVLKGAHTIVAAPDGRIAISPYANPLLAVAGTGDVLAGAIGGLLAQGTAPFEAAACGVYIHGMAGEELSDELGDRGLLASELLPQIPRAIRTILQGKRLSSAASPFAGLGDLGALSGLASRAVEP
jgi:NAD(P)H-hydrate epimerase